MPNLDRFLRRQEETHAQALAELRAGRKLTHWIWWELPQLQSLWDVRNGPMTTV